MKNCSTSDWGEHSEWCEIHNRDPLACVGEENDALLLQNGELQKKLAEEHSNYLQMHHAFYSEAEISNGRQRAAENEERRADALEARLFATETGMYNEERRAKLLIEDTQKLRDELQESNRLNSEKDRAIALLSERIRGLLPHRDGTMPCSGPGCNFCDDEENQEPLKRVVPVQLDCVCGRPASEHGGCRNYRPNKPCPSTYTHSSLGKPACEKDEAHLRRTGDVEHRRGQTIWMSI